MTLTSTNSKRVTIYNIVRESDKAVMINMPVTWNDNMTTRSFWFPKSCIEIEGKTMIVAMFLLDKLSKENAYNGYRMYFDEYRN